MIKVAGVWDFGWNTPIKEMELWEYPLKDYGVDEFIMSPVSGISNNYVTEVADFGLYINDHRNNGYTIVFLDEKASTTLENFVHPATNVLYVFGKAAFSPMTAYGQLTDTSLKIVTPNNMGNLWPHQAAVLVLNDRFIKGL